MSRCSEVHDEFSSYIDGALDRNDEANVRRHLESCPSCRALVDDLARITAAARLLGPIEPPAHIWRSVQSGLQRTSGAPTPAAATVSWAWAGLAAALICVSVGAYILAGRLVSEGPAGTPAVASGSIDAVAGELAQAADHYERAIAELEVLTPADDHVDPMLAAVVRDNVGILDHAITESRIALEADPTNEPARSSLFEALRRKVDLLQATALLMDEQQTQDAPATTDGHQATERQS